MKKPWAILLAAGEGKRFKQTPADTAKQFFLFKGMPLFGHSVRTLAAIPGIQGLILVFPAADLEYAASLMETSLGEPPLGLPYKIVAGGEERQDSVWNALNALPPDCDALLIHDAARPFAGSDLAARILNALQEGALGAVPGLEPTDTIKETDETGLVRTTLPRSALRLIQTPQGFDRRTLCLAYAQGREASLRVTDDAAMLEYSGFPVLVLPGERNNHKITRPEDLELLHCREKNPDGNRQPRTGFGYDVHRYGGDRPLKLGGVFLPSSTLTVQAHSDGDVLLHALIDALLGCICAGDIGLHFPDSDPRYNNINSAILLSEVLELTRERGFQPAHADMTIVAQSPKLAPFRAAIIKNVAHLLHLDEKQVNLKATTEEGLGFTGAGQGIKAMAIVSGIIRA